MPNMSDIKDLVSDLHDRKIINANATVAELLSARVNLVGKGGPEEAGWYVLGGEHFVVVCGLTAGSRVLPGGGGGPFAK